MLRGVKPTALSRPISRRWASTRPLITVATVKPTTSSASSVLTLITSEFVRVWSVIVSRTSCQSLKLQARAGQRALRGGLERVGRLGVAEPDRRRGGRAPVTSGAQTMPGSQRG